MLIFLAGHFIDNPMHIDKIISIKGLPDSFFFKNCKYGGKELVDAWKPAIESNIHPSIRHLIEEHEIKKVFPPIEKGRDSIVDTYKIKGVILDYTRGPGQEMWEKIERYLDSSVPRDQIVPKPVLSAPNQKSDFNPHLAKRTTRGSLELRPSEVPDIDLRPKIDKLIEPIKQVELKPIQEVIKEEKKIYPCKKCDQKFNDLGSFRVHNMKGHKKETVGV